MIAVIHTLHELVLVLVLLAVGLGIPLIAVVVGGGRDAADYEAQEAAAHREAQTTGGGL